ncbi:MAG: site-2 protease family protein [Anaerolineae bacterium]|nr:site-2 protease family protein [Anaerolineae bacterium]
MLDILVPWRLIGRILGLIIGFSFHEFAHAWTADRMGDSTPRFQGRLTLDPRSHIEVWGIVMAILTGFGWAKPVPVNPRAFYPNERRGLLIVAAAGPLMNLVIAAVLSLPVRLLLLAVDVNDIYEGWFTRLLFRIWLTVIFFNITLFFFNLIPLAPLDGWKVLLGLLPIEQAIALQKYEQESNFALIMIIFAGYFIPQINIIGELIGGPISAVYSLMTGL